MLYASVCMLYRVSMRCACYPTDKRLKEKRQPAVLKPADCRLPFSHSENITHEVSYEHCKEYINTFFTTYNYTEQIYRSQATYRNNTEKYRIIYIYVYVLQKKLS